MKRLRTVATTTAALTLMGLSGCSPAAPQPTPPAPPPAETPAPTAKPEAKPETKPEPAPPKTLKPDVPSMADIKRPAAPAGLEKAAKLIAEKNFHEAKLDLEENIKTHRRKGTLDVKVQAYAMLGLALAHTDDESGADRAYRRVIPYADRPEKQIQKETKDEKEAEKRLAAVMHGIGEALFHLAEKKRRQVDNRPFPAYDGNGAPDDVKKHAKRKIKGWVGQRQRRIERARDEYLKITELKPLPAPWVVAAASRVGAMWAQAAYQCVEENVPDVLTQQGDSAIPKPGAVKAKPAPAPADGGAAPAEAKPAMYTYQELRAVYDEAIGEVCSPLVERAKEAYGKCQEHAQTYGQDSVFAKSCASWLKSAP